ncbi:flagellin Hag [Alkalicoccobacillus porphyridii]|uniref:Flagellin n=1 Tax=Alkalicoccobacillus porphyridii TaxID=2597270 RepID=A0A554A493_9BACI|nr:flagellin Hag [Alkalicoccobacillus porphyridii]TSB48501.1 flagellin [Alkalicoccobacillus porphyridii]
MIINHNLSAMNAHRQLGANQAAGAKAQEKLSSGLRINRAGDDAAGLAISEKMRAQVRGLDQASRNAQDGISLIQTAEGALNETHSILQRMRELAVQAANDTNDDDTDRAAIQEEVKALIEEIDRISTDTKFNGKDLLTGTETDFTFHIGADTGQMLELSIADMSAEGLSVNTIDLSTRAEADTAIETINTAINLVSTERSKLGAVQNRLEHTISNLDNSAENLQAAESRIRDVDMAKEIMEFTKNNILSQASQAMLAQANQAPQAVLQLLG